jgi:hypothetical protein
MIRYQRLVLPGERWARITFIILLLLAAVLRFWRLPEMPYMHDEISALVRMYPTLFETVKTGVIEKDTHPPGVQVFEWLWTKLFGFEEHVLKFPFILMSLAGIFYIYRTAITWTCASTAILVIGLLATLQYSVMYGQIARPYAAGFFTTALIADQLTRFIAYGGRTHLRGMLIGIVLSAYTHHFTLMLAAIMAISGILLIRKEQRKGYFFMCGLAILLYLPNLPIFFRQLRLGGLNEWLAPPDRYWLPDYFMYISHWSVPFAILLGAIIIISLVMAVMKRNDRGPAFLVFLLWGIIPLIIGYVYSVFRAPVLQYSVLLFSFPYLLLALLYGLRHVPVKIALPLTALVTAVSIFTLIHERQHYEVLYESKYEAMVEEGLKAVKEKGQLDAAVLFDAPEDVIQFYMRLWDLKGDLPYIQLRDLRSNDIDQHLRALEGKLIVYGQSNGSSPETPARIQKRFPFLLQRKDLPEGQVLVFSDDSADVNAAIADRRMIAWATPIQNEGPWQIDPYMSVVDEEFFEPAWDFTDREFGLAMELLTDTLIAHRHDVFESIASVRVRPTGKEAAVSAQLFQGDSSLFYRDGRLDELMVMDGPASIFVSVSPVDVGDRKKDIRLKTYIYNFGKGPLAVERMELWLRKANPWQYAIFRKVP